MCTNMRKMCEMVGIKTPTTLRIRIECGLFVCVIIFADIFTISISPNVKKDIFISVVNSFSFYLHTLFNTMRYFPISSDVWN